MRMPKYVGLAAGLAVLSLGLRAQSLTGRVGSAAEARMEGVVVTASRADSNIAISVVSRADGVYTFPAGSLKPGTYSLEIRAIGYDLAGHPQADVSAGHEAHVNLTLVKTKDLPAQMTSSEWLQSVPGTLEQKTALYHCAACHSITPIVQSTYDAKSWLPVLVRMRNYSGQSVRTSPVVLNFRENIKPDPYLANYLASINQGSDSKWNYKTAKLVTQPRPTGAATHVIMTTYTLAPGSLPHDVVVDHRRGPTRGDIWFNDFQRDIIGRLDPDTGAVKTWDLPPLKPGFPAGQLSLKWGKDGNLWIPRFRKAGMTRFNPNTEKFTTWRVPKAYDNSHADTSHVSPCGPGDIVWFPDTENRVMYRLDPNTGKIGVFQLFPNYHPTHTVDVYGHAIKPNGHRSYGTACDSEGNVYYADIAGGTIGRIDAQTGHATLYKTPTLESGPRRMSMDPGDHLWFGENYSSKLGMFDTHTHQFKEWTPPIPWNGAYPAMRDGAHGDVWTGGMSTDYIYSMDPHTGVFTDYLLPVHNGEIRWITVDSTTKPSTVWVPMVHRGKIIKLVVTPH